MGTNSPGIEHERIGHEVAFGEKLAIAVVCVSTQKAFVNGVVNNFNPRPWDAKQLLYLALSKLGNSEDPGRSSEHPARKLKMQKAPEPGVAVGAIHVFEHIVYGHHIGTRQGSWQPEQMRDVNQIATQMPENVAECQRPLNRGVTVKQRNGMEIGRQGADLCHLLRQAHKKVLVMAIQPAEGAYHIARIGAHPKFGHPADVDGDFHGKILITADTNVGSFRRGLRSVPWLFARDTAEKLLPSPAPVREFFLVPSHQCADARPQRSNARSDASQVPSCRAW